jgi:hypothetical protein
MLTHFLFFTSCLSLTVRFPEEHQINYDPGKDHPHEPSGPESEDLYDEFVFIAKWCRPVVGVGRHGLK